MSTTSARRPGRALLAGAIAVASLAGAPAARAATVGTPEVVAETPPVLPSQRAAYTAGASEHEAALRYITAY